MKKKTIALILFAITGAAFLFAAFEERVTDGGPIHYPQLFLAITFFAIAFAVSRDKAGPPKAPS